LHAAERAGPTPSSCARFSTIEPNPAFGRNVTVAKASDEDVQRAFQTLVNLTARELAAWLETTESKSVGQDSGDGESIGRKSGKRILAILSKQSATVDDRKHMRRVVSFIRRHAGQGPRRNVATSRWRYSLMNWGHDPLKERESDSPWH
jgi:hypothetical protein